MSASAPVTQDVLTIPRKLPEGGRANLVGLTRPALREALIGMGTPEKQAKMRANQLWQWIYQKGVRDFADMTNLAKDYRAKLDAHFVVAVPEIVSKNVSADAQTLRAPNQRWKGPSTRPNPINPTPPPLKSPIKYRPEILPISQSPPVGPI